MFGSLLDQADFLLSRKYALAAAVLGRVVLEERMRDVCQVEGCTPAKPRPGIEDYKNALVSAGRLTSQEGVMLAAENMTGNKAAHNKDDFAPTNVPEYLQFIRNFLDQQQA